jgi:hypothetical protein
MHYIQITAAFNQAAKLCPSAKAQQASEAGQELRQQLHSLAEQVLQQQCDARGLASIIWSCAYMDRADTVQLLLPELLQDSKLQQANAQDMSNVPWSCATLELQPAEDYVQQLVQGWCRCCPRPPLKQFQTLCGLVLP